MLGFANGKINLGLRITSKREDAYHNLETLFYPIQKSEPLEILTSNKLTFEATGIPILGDAETNLCIKAYKLLKQDFDIAPVKIRLHKLLPMGAGIGGGSSDGAVTLNLLNTHFQLGLTENQLEAYAVKLGADCPFFIRNKPIIATGIGNVFEEINFSLNGYKLVCIYPKIHVSTKEAFSRVVPAIPEKTIREVLKPPISRWKSELINDFEKSVFHYHPKLKEIKTQLYNLGALYASMSGSGSLVYGIFENGIDLKEIQTSFTESEIWEEVFFK